MSFYEEPVFGVGEKGDCLLLYLNFSTLSDKPQYFSNYVSLITLLSLKGTWNLSSFLPKSLLGGCLCVILKIMKQIEAIWLTQTVPAVHCLLRRLKQFGTVILKNSFTLFYKWHPIFVWICLSSFFSMVYRVFNNFCSLFLSLLHPAFLISEV